MPNRATDEPSAPVDRFLTTPVFAVLLAVILLLGGVSAKQHFTIAGLETEAANERAAHAKTKADNAEVLRDLAQRTATVAAQVRAREGQFQRDTAAAEEQHRQEKANAIAKKDRVIADLRSGALQLQPWWQCEATGATAGNSTDAAGPSDSGGNAGTNERRIQDSGDLVQVGADADAKERWLRAELIATRALCGMGAP